VRAGVPPVAVPHFANERPVAHDTESADQPGPGCAPSSIGHTAMVSHFYFYVVDVDFGNRDRATTRAAPMTQGA
jgi:hypothetical protein